MIRKGRGIAGCMYSLSCPCLPNPCTANVLMREDGSLNIQMGIVDIGQGAQTALCMMAAEFFTIPVEKVRIYTADTHATPHRLRRAFRFPAARLRCSPACSSPCLAIHPLSPASGAAPRFRRRAAALRAGCFCMLFHPSIHFPNIIPQKSPRRALFFIYIEPLTAVDGSGISRYNTFYIYLCHTVFFFAGFPSGNSTFTGRGCLT